MMTHNGKLPPFIKESKEGVLLLLHIQPKVSRNRIVGLHGDRLKLAVQAPPTDGKANKAVQQLLSKITGLPRSKIILKSGATSREKSFLLRKAETKDILKRLGF